MVNILAWPELGAICRASGWDLIPAVTAVAITQPESSRDADAIQAGQPYATTGWGLWQITPGNSEPQCGIDNQLLDPLNNGRAALAKYQGAGNSFQPWTTFVNGLELPWLTDAEYGVAFAWNLSNAQLLEMLIKARVPLKTPSGPGPQASNWAGHVHRAAAAVHHTSQAWTAGAAAVRQVTPRYRPPAVRPATPDQILPKPERL